MKRSTQILVLRISLMVYSLILSALYPFLPDTIPMKYNFDGSIQSSLPKLLAILVVLAINVGLLIYQTLIGDKTKPLALKAMITQALLMLIGLIGLTIPLWR